MITVYEDEDFGTQLTIKNAGIYYTVLCDLLVTERQSNLEGLTIEVNQETVDISRAAAAELSRVLLHYAETGELCAIEER